MDALAVFNEYRSLLFAIAYRMLGSVSDAEDILQEVWIRWQSSSVEVRSPKSFLSSITTRLCIDQLRSARKQREQYVGTWLPEPIATGNEPQGQIELAESLSFAFLTLLECLSPTERAVFLLREVFDYDYGAIAEVVGKSIVNCRQIARRARLQLSTNSASQPYHPPSSPEQTATVTQFLQCWHQGDINGLVNLMAPEVSFYSDGGGKANTARRPLRGIQKVSRFLVAIQTSRLIPKFRSEVVELNGQSGILNHIQGQTQSVFNFSVEQQKIQTILAVVNPDKLRAIHHPWSVESPLNSPTASP